MKPFIHAIFLIVVIVNISGSAVQYKLAFFVRFTFILTESVCRVFIEITLGNG